MQKKHKILICAGGTGGHILPAMRLAKTLLKEEHHVIFSGMDLSTNPYFEKEEFIFFDIPSSSVQILHPLKMLSRWLKGVVKSFFLLKRFKPEIIVGFGSFHTFPLLLCAKMLNISYILFESNVCFGKVNRLFFKKAKSVASIFPSSKKTQIVDLHLLTNHMKVLQKNEAREKLHLKKDKFTLLVFGGSQGASFLNENILKIADKYTNDFQIIHITGSEKEKEKVKNFYNSKNILSYVQSFEKNMSLIYSAADLAITRAGAATMAELIYFSLPAIMVPYPFSSEGHQKNNALFFQNEVKGGKCLSQNKITTDLLLQSLENMGQNAHLEKLKRNILSYKEKRKNMNILSLHKLVYKSLEESHE